MFTVVGECFLTLFPSSCVAFLGFSPRGSYSSTSPYETSWVSQHHLLDSYSRRINGTNGSVSSLFLKKDRVLDAFDDEYEGVVVDPEQLPSNPHVFAYALRSSLHHWKIKVFYSLVSFKEFSVLLQLHCIRNWSFNVCISTLLFLNNQKTNDCIYLFADRISLRLIVLSKLTLGEEGSLAQTASRQVWTRACSHTGDFNILLYSCSICTSEFYFNGVLFVNKWKRIGACRKGSSTIMQRGLTWWWLTGFLMDLAFFLLMLLIKSGLVPLWSMIKTRYVMWATLVLCFLQSIIKRVYG